MVGSSIAPTLFTQSEAQQSAAGHSVAQNGDEQSEQAKYREKQRQEDVHPVTGFLQMEEAKASGYLDLVGPPQHHRQPGHDCNQSPGENQQLFHVVVGEHSGVENRLGDPDAALYCHDAAQEQGAETEEHQGSSKGVAHNALRVKGLPFLVKAVNRKYQGAVDEVTQQVSDHQAAGEQQEGRPGLDSDALVGFDQDKDGQAVGQDAHCHGDDGRSNGELLLADVFG